MGIAYYEAGISPFIKSEYVISKADCSNRVFRYKSSEIVYPFTILKVVTLLPEVILNKYIPGVRLERS